MLQYLTKIPDKLQTILSTGVGWVTAIGLFIADFFAGHAFIAGLVVFVTLMDAVWGIAVSIGQGKFTLSELARLTIQKLAVYGCAMAVFVGLDKMGDTRLTASIVGAAIVLVEWWSTSASMLVCFPDMPFLKLMRKALKGEIASKLSIAEEEVEEVLKEKSKKK